MTQAPSTPPKAATVLVAGCGYVGTELATRLADLGQRVWGLRRRARPTRPHSVRWLSADLCNRQQLDACLPPRLDAVVYCASSDARSEAAYARAYVQGLQTLLAALEGRGTERLLFTSSTAVYGQSGGERVDEQSLTEPAHFSGRLMLEAEALVANSPARGTVLRCSGIYGPGRTRLVEQVRRGELLRASEGRLTNRIHRDDLVGATQHVLKLPAPPPCVVLSDDEPATSETVAGFIASQLGVELHNPVTEPRSLSAQGKRCDNTLLRKLGYRLQYPTYREGYAPLCEPH